MTIRQLEFGTITFFTLAACIGVFLAFYNNSPKVIKTYALPSTTGINTESPKVTPIFTAKEESFSQISPDGTKKVIMNSTSNADATKKYTFITADTDNNQQVQIYSITLSENESMSVPFNTFSPDNKYFFTIHQKSGVNEAVVFRTDGENMTETEKYFEVAKTFAEKEIKNPYKETTGWASETLLIINTTPENGGKQSYWFEIPTKAIIGLSTQFYD